ncbi:hypothetical protein [Xanthomonas arboricola]|uniref:hypothetical protein n=1 Tax=Xanthomonas arboricola TaxID=56448 RepID=UPI0017B6A47C|nr:hypothetical protein [Xanthomonas arboricola]MBB3848855.1 hypothetical protein [Xanthomonas arboricola]
MSILHSARLTRCDTQRTTVEELQATSIVYDRLAASFHGVSAQPRCDGDDDLIARFIQAEGTVLQHVEIESVAVPRAACCIRCTRTEMPTTKNTAE